ncbi:MAG: VWA domain-containing protein [Spirochaetes bacterium]|nr:VWA domain-containing protein [Spirochaetota bacterium]
MINLRNIKNEENLNLHKFVIEYDEYNLYLFNYLLNNSIDLKNINNKGLEIYSKFTELLQDVFNIFYKYNPKLYPKNEIKYDYLLNYEIIDTLLQNEDIHKVRSITIGSDIDCLIAIEYFAPLLFELLEKYKDSIKEYETQLDTVMGPDDTPIDYDEAVKKLEEYKNKLVDGIKQEISTFSYKIKNIMYNIIETSEYLASWGLSDTKTFTKTSLEGKLEIFNKIKNSPKLKEIVNLSGRFKSEYFNNYKQNMKIKNNSYSNLTKGNDLSKLIPTELIKLSDNVLESLFYKDFEEKNLFQYELESKSKKGKGPIIICIDSSGSMEGLPEIFAKAVALTILDIAKMENRSVYVIHFSDERNVNSLHCNEYLKNKNYNKQDIFNMLEYFVGGGTNFEPALTLAKQKIDTEQNFSKADIIFITDGEAPVSPKWLQEFLEWKKSKNVYVYSILIDVTLNSDISIKKFSDEIQVLSKLTKKEMLHFPKELLL